MSIFLKYKYYSGLAVCKPNTFVLILVAACLLLPSCVPTKDIIYLQTAVNSVYENEAEAHQLKTGDVLSIRIISLDKNVDNIFQRQDLSSPSIQAAVQNGGDPYFLQGYPVSEKGEISIPFIGEVFVQGLTISEAYNVIYNLVSSQLSNFELDIRLGGIRFSALGEFNRPGKHVVMQNQVTILEALALSGDLTHLANRKELKVIRREQNGSRIIELNLLETDFLSSEEFFIQSDDVIYAEPLPQKAWGFGVTGAQTLSAVLSTLGTGIAMTLSILSLTR